MIAFFPLMQWTWSMERLEEYWTIVKDVWSNGIYGVDVGQIIIALAIFCLFLIIRHGLKRFVLSRLIGLTARTKTSLDDSVIQALERPVSWLPAALGFYFASQYLSVPPNVDAFFDNITRSVAAFLIFWALYRSVLPVSIVLQTANRFLTQEIVSWLVKLARVAFFLIGAAAILEIWGIAVGPLVAGLGLFGVAVALGAQDLFKNLIAGLFIISERRFNRGDWILVDGVVEGTVEDIGFRTTKIRRFDKAPVYVPNGQLADKAVTNFSRMTYRRISWTIGLEYGTSLEQLRQVRDGIEQYIHNNPDFVTPEEASTFVRVDKFNDSSIDIFLYCFTRTTVWGEWLRIKEELVYAIKAIVEQAGTGFAFPSRSLYVESLPSSQHITVDDTPKPVMEIS